MKQNLFNKLWLRVGMIVAIMTTALAGTAWAEEITFNFENLANANNWENGVAYTSVEMSPITLSADGGGNNAKYYTSDKTWRMYGGGTVNITAASGYTITEVTSNPSQTFTINNGSASLSCSATIKFKSITVTYTTSGGGGDTPSPTEGTGTISFGSGANQTAINSASVTGNDDLGNTWTITTEGTTSFTANSAYYQVGSSNKPATSITFTTTLASELNITAMSAKFGGFNGTAGSVTLKVGETTIGTGSLNGSSDVTVNSTSAAAGTVLTVTVTGIAKGVKCYYISYTCTSSSNPVCETPTFTPEAGTYIGTQNVTIACATDGATIYYTTDGTNPTEDSNVYSSAIPVSSTTTIKAIAVAEDYNNSPVASAAYTIVNLAHAGTEADPYTVADAYAAIDGNVGITDVCVAGVISQVDSYNSTYHSITYWISSDGTTTSDQLEVYGGLNIEDEEPFSSIDDLAVGDVVVVKGTLKKYGNTYEFDKDNRLVSLSREQHAATIPVEDSEVAFGSTFTIDASTILGGAITVISSNTNVATVEGLVITPVAVGTTTITVATAETDAYYAGSATFTLTVTAPEGKEAAAFATEEIVLDFTDNTDWGFPEGSTNKTVEEGTFTDGGYTVKVEGSSGNGYYFNTDGYLLFGKQGASLTLPAFDKDVIKIEVVGRDGASGVVQQNIYVGETAVSTETTGATGTNVYEIASDYQAAGTIYTLRVVSAHNTQITQIKITFRVVADPITYTIPSSGLGTFCSEYPLDLSTLPEGVKAYVVTEYTTTSVKLTQIETAVKGGTGIIIEGTGDDVVEFESVNCSTEPENELVGTLAPVYLAANTAYGLKSGQFHPNNAGTIGKNRAYLPAKNGTAVKPLTIEFDDATGITRTRTFTDEETIYNLAGQRISKMQKGINIVNGKKILK